MAQGKLKVKAKLPAKAKASSVHRGNSNLKKSRGNLIWNFYLDINLLIIVFMFL